jgi:hypothetical protein
MEKDLFELSKLLNQDIVNIIDAYCLKGKLRDRELVYKRYYLYHVLHFKRHLTTRIIGMYFNRDHSTVSVGIQKHNYWWSIQDKNYLRTIHPLPDILANKQNLGDDQYKLEFTYIDEEISKVSIIGNFNWKNLDKLPDILTKEQLQNLFL